MIRGVGLRSAVAINVATMVGAGPFITLPLVVTALHGSVSAVAWIVGALIAACDGLVWAELASRYPRSGGTYTYLREAFGRDAAGRFTAFVFVWQFMFWAPLIIASGYIGFAQYAAYLVPAVGSPVATHALAAAVGALTLAALYRAIPSIARTALVLGAVALATLVVVALAGLSHPYAPLTHTLPATLTLGAPLPALGAALVLTLYDYGGYGDVCALGDEVVAPARTIPLSVVLSVAFVGFAYVLLNLGVAAAIPPADIERSSAIASTVAERAFGSPFAVAVTVAVLITAFGSTYGLLLAAARVPYAAAANADFLEPFARLHPTGRFPAVALVTIGVLAIPASLLPLDAVIAALTAGIVLVQGAGQVVALAIARAMHPEAPFRVPLYPLPPLIALVGWMYLFWFTGPRAMAFGIVTLAAGAIVYLVRARLSRLWPFATSAVVVLLAALPTAANAQPPPSFGHAVIVRREGEPQLQVDGKPFFFLGGAFFYERIPRSRWRADMRAMRSIGANTLDLYVPWNWHETSEGAFDFDGHTNPRRDLRDVLRLGRELGFRFIVRPGPVIRNEWRNGGYPAWLLQRPEYGMPPHDVLEGRYPATATLQNAQSDAAAGEWMRNRSHRFYAARWLHRALAEFRPVADRVLAVQLDDDQGAYLDNDTFPAPHLHAYLGWLEAQVRDVIGRRTPVFINTFEMKVPSSSPVWAMGNWYQSDAYAIGEHDRSELAFATASLRTQSRVPLAYSEFQAGWLAGPEDPLPRPADPSNTTLALGELTGLGLKGLIDFPLLDTLAPFGWEAPFSNALYRWDAAFPLNPFGSPPMFADDPVLEQIGRSIAAHDFNRFYTTRRLFGALAFYGPALEEARRVAPVALTYDGRTDAFAAAAALKSGLGACRLRGIGCDVIDPLAVDDARLRSLRVVVVPHGAYPALRARARALHVGVVETVSDVARVPVTPNATVLAGPHGTFAVVENWSARPLAVDPRTFGAPFRTLPRFVMPPRDARIVAAGVTLAFLDARYRAGDTLTTSCAFDGRTYANVAIFTAGYRPFEPHDAPTCETDATLAGNTVRTPMAGPQTAALGAAAITPRRQLITVGRTVGLKPLNAVQLAPGTWVPHAFPPRDEPSEASVRRDDVFEDGRPAIVLSNARVRAVVVPDGGARVVSFGTNGFGLVADNVFDATGALRDDVLVQPPPSATDRIAKYTHSYPAGTFNRAYDACTFARIGTRSGSAAGAYLAYDAPDVIPAGARFERVLALTAASDRLIADLRLTPHGRDPAQRLVSSSAISIPGVRIDDGTARRPSDQPADLDTRAGGVLFWGNRDPNVFQFSGFSVAWRPGDVESASWTPARSNGTLKLVLSPGAWHRLALAFLSAPDEEALITAVQAERAWAAANPAPSSEDGEVAKRYTQSPQKRPSESSCGFESHLPQ